MNTFFFLGLACLLKKGKTKTEVWLIYNKHELFFYQIEFKLFMNNFGLFKILDLDMGAIMQLPLDYEM